MMLNKGIFRRRNVKFSAFVWVFAFVALLLGCSDSGKNSPVGDEDLANDSTSELEENSPFDPTGYVDPFIGTAGDHGQLSPSASYPFGMVHLGPDTVIRSHSGYDYDVEFTLGFSHTRIDGVGCNGVGGDVRVLPGTSTQSDASLAMYKDTEIAEPGYYGVELGDEANPIRAEMTVTAHAGLHRYQFPDGEAPKLSISFNDPMTRRLGGEWEANTAKDGIDGWVSAGNVCNEGAYTLYFSMAFSRPFASIERVSSSRGGEDAVLLFEADHRPLLVKVGLSSVDSSEAANDRDLEIPAWDFDTVREQAREAWREWLSRIEVEGEEEYKTLFYTMLYRTLLTPANITTHSSLYRGTDGEIHEADGYRRYHGWSLWDTYRNKFALIAWLDPGLAGDIMQSLVDLYREGKVAWSTEYEPYPNVRTEHAAALLLDATRKNVGGFDVESAFDAILEEAETLPEDSPDKQLETSYDGWAIAQLAKILEKNEIYDEYLARAAQYETLWRETFKTMGDDADEMHARGLYEGTLWQYRWAVPHDISGIIELDGGLEAFRENLVFFFENELYNHGNEPGLHVPFLFNYVGEPWRTQDLVRSLLVEEVQQWYGTHEKWEEPFVGRIYRAQPEGLIPEMDDDDGTMSAWFVWASLGMYPVTIGQPVFALTAPVFEKAVLHLGEDVTWTVEAPGVSSSKRYIKDATLNGEELPRAWLHYGEASTGGMLRFSMDETKSAWGAATEDAPPPAFE